MNSPYNIEYDINKLKEKALRMLLEEHLMKVGESDSFHFGGGEYKIERLADGFFGISVWLGDKYGAVKEYSTLGKLFTHFFRCNNISY